MNNEITPKNSVLFFPVLFQEINDVLEKIRLCDSVKIAEINFDILEEIHLMMTKCIYVQKISLPEVFVKFFKDFEQVYSIDGREYLFNEIKHNNYMLDFEQFFMEEIGQLFKKIKDCMNVEEVKIYFDCLDKVQLMIALLICEKNVKVSPILKQFFKEFDHIGEEGERDYLFNKIKNNTLKTFMSGL